MTKNRRETRPCSICRRWFRPIVQQKGRQRTCSPACRQELHRRQCEQWNKKNKAYFKSNYLADKIRAIDQQEQSKDPPADHQPARPNASVFFLHQAEPILPMDIIIAQMGKKNAVIIQYLIFQLRHVHAGTSGFP